jgi:site-specific DNA-cytosine methylase
MRTTEWIGKLMATTWDICPFILGWECQGFSVAGFGEGLNDTRSDLFTDMVGLITWAQSISPMFGYVIENTPSQLDQGEKI